MDNHNVTIENQNRIEVTEVKSLEAFDEEAILANLENGGLIIKGENLTVENLDVDQGVLVAKGKILTISYVKAREKRKLPKLIKR